MCHSLATVRVVYNTVQLSQDAQVQFGFTDRADLGRHHESFGGVKPAQRDLNRRSAVNKFWNFRSLSSTIYHLQEQINRNGRSRKIPAALSGESSSRHLCNRVRFPAPCGACRAAPPAGRITYSRAFHLSNLVLTNAAFTDSRMNHQESAAARQVWTESQ